MARIKTSFFCTECGHEASGWLGRCPGCGAWNTLVEEKKTAKNIAGGGSWVSAQTKDPVPARLADVTATTAGRLSSGIGEFDRVLGGGFVRGSLVLIGGDPGIGKSTLLLQVFGHMSTSKKILYVTGEESPQQVKIRADRLGLGDSRRGHLLAATGFSVIEQVLLRDKPDLAIIDSIQTLFVEELNAAPGSVSQVREATAGLLRLAKEQNIIIVLVGHVTKDGAIAGPRVLEHMVDTVLYFESTKHLQLRLLRAVKLFWRHR